ncbi:MAG: DUF2225 domain-containing protein, partial [Chloroflexota bacterium]|nr:DUF2225 domain-containing protein [Chloroflexota bacterium]
MAAPNAQLLEDLKKLFGLKDKLGATFGKNDIVYFPGAPADTFHVVLKGRVQIDGEGHAAETLGPGEIFGEVDVFTNRPRRGKATALDDTTTLAFDRDSAVVLAETTPHFVVTIIEKCCQRVLRAEQAPGPAIDVQAGAPAQPAAAAAEARQPAPSPAEAGTVGPVLDVDYKPALWKKDVVCPNCRTKFGAWNVRTNSITIEKRDTDLMSIYGGVNPNLYSVWVCPNCQLAAYADDFPNVQSVDLGRIKPQLEEIRGQDHRTYDFGFYRNEDLALRSYQLAVATYRGKRGGEDKVAGLYHRMAWIERGRGSAEEEKKYLQTAKEAYEKAFSTLDAEKQGVVWAYLVAELNLRLGNFADAVRWFSTASQQPNFKDQPVIEEMTRDRWSEAGELSK